MTRVRFPADAFYPSRGIWSCIQRAASFLLRTRTHTHTRPFTIGLCRHPKRSALSFRTSDWIRSVLYGHQCKRAIMHRRGIEPQSQAWKAHSPHFRQAERSSASYDQNAETRDRTGDLQIFSLALSQLSYRGLGDGAIMQAHLQKLPHTPTWRCIVTTPQACQSPQAAKKEWGCSGN